MRTRDYGLVIADWNMLEMTGVDLLHTIRQDTRLSELPVIMLTSRNEKENIQEALEAGVSGYIVKPFNQETLTDRLQKIFNPLSA